MSSPLMRGKMNDSPRPPESQGSGLAELIEEMRPITLAELEELLRATHTTTITVPAPTITVHPLVTTWRTDLDVAETIPLEPAYT